MIQFKYRFFSFSVIFTILMSFSLTLDAQETSKDSIIVGTAGSAPFNIKTEKGEDPSGIAVEIWEEIAEQNDWNYKYKPFSDFDKGLKAVENGDVDVLAGPISITADRADKMPFTQPFYQSSLSIVSKEDHFSLWGFVKSLFNYKLLMAVLGFLFMLAIVGALLWLAERKTAPDEEFPEHKPAKGIGRGMWLAIVTMSTVGYGDLAARTAFGRIVTGIWIVLSIIFATSMVAGISSSLTLGGLGGSTISQVEELAGRKVATVKNSTAADFIKANDGQVVPANDFDEAMEFLRGEKADAVVFDRPQLLYYQNQHQDADLHISQAEYYKQGYGFALSPETDIDKKINLTLLDLAEDLEVQKIVVDYLGEDQ